MIIDPQQSREEARVGEKNVMDKAALIDTLIDSIECDNHEYHRKSL